VDALASDLPSRNGWTIGEQAGDRSPAKSQRLLNRASWDEESAMSQVRRYAAAGLDAAACRSRRRRMTVGALDETGQEKQGSASSGVKRQYMGCAGRVANGINTVHLSYVREKTGHALAGARQWIPAEAIKDPVKSLVAGLPPGLRFRTKGELAIDVLGGAYADGLAFDFVCGDEVYGSCTGLREFLEARGQAYVLRVASNFTLTLAAGITIPGLIPLSVREIRRLLAAELSRPKPPGHAAHWLEWRRRHQARSRWFHKRARLERNYALVS
jgi:SRSO17 transposase